MLALVDALDTWRHYLYGASVIVHTDNMALSHLQRNSKTTMCQVRWIERLQAYPHLQIVHIPGVQNKAADAFSRHPLLREAFEPANPTVLGEVELSKLVSSELGLHWLEVVDTPELTPTDFGLNSFEALAEPISFYFTGPFVAPLTTEKPEDDWLPIYASDEKLRDKYFVQDDRQEWGLKNPKIFKNGRIWEGDRIVVPKEKVG